MDALLRFFTAREVWIYILLGLVGLVYVRKLVLAIQEWRGAIFGLERNNAQRRLNESASILALLALFALAEFVLVTFVAPAIPGVKLLPTPTLRVIGTPGPGEGTPAVTGSPSGLLPYVATLGSKPSSCIPGQLEFTEPASGSNVKGKVILKGTVRVPNFGFYKYEFAQPGNPPDWMTIQAGDHIRCSGEECINPAATDVPSDKLGEWDTSLLVPGDYLLRLVVTDNQGQTLPSCEISIRVTAP
ncbi:MAG: hypothetical protein PHQ40_07400 [Anaerolineaceae bacterium]|nr:hypothetical protein [Anaerolineaceae bacterium]